MWSVIVFNYYMAETTDVPIVHDTVPSENENQQQQQQHDHHFRSFCQFPIITNIQNHIAAQQILPHGHHHDIPNQQSLPHHGRLHDVVKARYQKVRSVFEVDYLNEIHTKSYERKESIKEEISDLVDELSEKGRSGWTGLSDRLERDLHIGGVAKNNEEDQDRSDVPTKRAVLIGINYRGTKNRLHGCINDANAIKKTLMEFYGFEEKNIVVLTDDSILKKKPTRSNIVKYLKKMSAITGPRDELVVTYSGHGSQVVCEDGDESLNPDTPNMDDVICPCDFKSYGGERGLIRDDELKEILVDRLPNGAKLRVVLDCCNSGTGLDLPFLFKGGDEFVNLAIGAYRCTDSLLLSGCRDDQTSADAIIDSKPTGALTWALLKSLEKSRKINMTWKELHTSIRIMMSDYNFEQIPAMSVGDKRVINETVDL